MLEQIDPPPAADDDSRHCGNCGYDLRGIGEPRCPECGTPFDPSRPAVAVVPWFHRRAIGNAAAVWRTWRLVAWRPGRLGAEVWLDSELHARDATRFRWICVTVASISAALSLMMLFVDLHAVPLGFAVAIGPVLLFFYMATSTIHDDPLKVGPESPARAERFVTLYHFTAAPLLALPLSPIVVAAARLSGRFTAGAVLLTLAIVAHWLVCTFAYQWRGAGRDDQWQARRIIASLAIWAVLAWLIFLVIMLIAQEVLRRPHGRR